MLSIGNTSLFSHLNAKKHCAIARDIVRSEIRPITIANVNIVKYYRMERNANDHRGSHLNESTDYHTDGALSEAKQNKRSQLSTNEKFLPTLTAVSST